MKKKSPRTPTSTSTKKLTSDLLKNAVGGDHWGSSDNPTIFNGGVVVKK